MPHADSLIITLVGGFVLAFVFGMLANRLKLSPLVGYLVAGVVVGPFTGGFVADTELAPQLAEVGVILLMFGVGLHFSPKDLMQVRKVAIPGAIVQIAAATILGWGLGRFLLGLGDVEAALLGFALSTASTVVLLRALEERKQLKSNAGRIAMGWLIVEDLVVVIALVLLPLLIIAPGETLERGRTGQVHRMDADQGRGLRRRHAGGGRQGAALGADPDRAHQVARIVHPGRAGHRAGDRLGRLLSVRHSFALGAFLAGWC